MTRIERIKKEIAAATEGPWQSSGCSVSTMRPDNSSIAVTWRRGWKTAQPLENAGNNATFIAHGRENIPWLVKMVERQAELIRDARAIILPKGYSNAEIIAAYVQIWSEKERALLAELEKEE